jgi:hypothetical protein
MREVLNALLSLPAVVGEGFSEFGRNSHSLVPDLHSHSLAFAHVFVSMNGWLSSIFLYK